MVSSRAEPRFRQIAEAVDRELLRRGYPPDATQVDRAVHDELDAVAMTGGLSPSLALSYAPDDVDDDILERSAPTDHVRD